jgi:uncharacterized protein (DUF1778 family)
MTVSAFLLGTAHERAKEILAEKEMVTLTSRDWVAFASAPMRISVAPTSR